MAKVAMTRRKSKAERYPINDGGPEVYRRLILEDGTSWPHPGNYCGRGEIGMEAYIGRIRELAGAYCDIVLHPWGTGAACQKVRMLRRALKWRAEKR